MGAVAKAKSAEAAPEDKRCGQRRGELAHPVVPRAQTKREKSPKASRVQM